MSSKSLLAYFSHSYRSSEKELNLFFWELLSRHKFYFTVDAEENSYKPMDVTYLEWMMRRCACFIAVIPRRKDELPYSCSPYQVFENGLAIRAKKPRLIFVEAGLNETIFGVQPDEVCIFRRGWLEEGKTTFMEAAERFAQKAKAFAALDTGLVKPVALLINHKAGHGYNEHIIEEISKTLRDYGFSINQAGGSLGFEHDFLFVQEIEKCSLLISEIRSPYISPDILGMAHD
jgi:hypothetical protein